MSYRFNSLIGRLVQGSSSLSAGLKETSKASSKIIYDHSVKFPEVSSMMTASEAKSTLPGYGKFKQLQKQFQIEDGVPIHLKRGTTDRTLYYLTVALCALGLEESLRYFYIAAFPEKPE